MEFGPNGGGGIHIQAALCCCRWFDLDDSPFVDDFDKENEAVSSMRRI
jgi:hypothetical protein